MELRISAVKARPYGDPVRTAQAVKMLGLERAAGGPRKRQDSENQ